MSALSVEPEPEQARALFGESIEKVREFAAHLGERGEPLGLIGPLESARLWSRHIMNSGVVAPLLGTGPVGDVGSGAGLPGLVLAAARPDVTFVLIEPMERRVEWLRDEARTLDLQNVQVLRARAEEAVLDEPLAQVTARAVAAFRKLIPICVPLLRHGGELVLMKGRSAAEEVLSAKKEIAKYRLRDVEVIEVGAGFVAETTRVIRAKVGD